MNALARVLSPPGSSERVRLYQSVRTAHLERAHQLPPARLIYAERRYDFEESLAAGLDLVDGRGWRAARDLFLNPPRILEINEPLMLESTLWTLAGVFGARLRTLLGRSVAIVTYAIENRDPRPDPPRRTWKARLRRRLELAAAHVLVRQIDRIAYGTAAARELYEDFGVPSLIGRLIWALPKPQAAGVAPRPVALFASAFALRKGIDTLLTAWPAVVRDLPEAQLVLIGKGAELERVQDAAASDPSLTVLVDPPRGEVLRWMENCRVVVLPSRPTASWREQVGLPIVEGLSYGRTIVTTSETGLAQWLAEHGHQVINPDDPAALAEALTTALHEPLDPATVAGALPPVDGRLAADAWMFGDEP